MMENQQLIKKDRSANSYSKIFPWTFTDLVLDRVTKESLDNILVRNNFIALPYVGSKAATRLQVPMKNRRRGIWLSYIDYAGTLTVEYYNDNNLDDNHWQDSSYWLPYNTAEFQPASVGLSALAQEVFDWINSQITTAVKLNPEDLQKNSSGQIEEANRAYDTSTFSGLGYRILRKNIQSNKNILTQSMINMPNTIYEIRYDFDLNGSTINIPENCVLSFVGGQLKNGTINFNNTKLEGNIKIKTNILGDIRNGDIYPEWFGAVGDGIIDDSNAFLTAFEIISNSFISIDKFRRVGYTNTLVLNTNKEYYITSSLELNSVSINIKGAGTLIYGGKNHCMKFTKCTGVNIDISFIAKSDFIDTYKVDWNDNPNRTAIILDGVRESNFKFDKIVGFTKGIVVTGDGNYGCYNNYFKLASMYNLYKSIVIESFNQYWPNNNVVEGGYFIGNIDEVANTIINSPTAIRSFIEINGDSIYPITSWKFKDCYFQGQLAVLTNGDNIVTKVFYANQYCKNFKFENIAIEDTTSSTGSVFHFNNDQCKDIEIDTIDYVDNYNFNYLGFISNDWNYLKRLHNITFKQREGLQEIYRINVSKYYEVPFRVESSTNDDGGILLSNDLNPIFDLKNSKFVNRYNPNKSFPISGNLLSVTKGQIYYYDLKPAGNIRIIFMKSDYSVLTSNEYNSQTDIDIFSNIGITLSTYQDKSYYITGSTNGTNLTINMLNNTLIKYIYVCSSNSTELIISQNKYSTAVKNFIFENNQYRNGGFIINQNINSAMLTALTGDRIYNLYDNKEYRIINSGTKGLDLSDITVTAIEGDSYITVTGNISKFKIGNIVIIDNYQYTIRSISGQSLYVTPSIQSSVTNTIVSFKKLIFEDSDKNVDGTLLSKEVIVRSIDEITLPNIIYKIVSDIDLNNTTLTLPANCTLDFQGGSFSNGTIIGNCKITGNVSNIFGDNLILFSTSNSNLQVIDSNQCKILANNSFISLSKRELLKVDDITSLFDIGVITASSHLITEYISNGYLKYDTTKIVITDNNGLIATTYDSAISYNVWDVTMLPITTGLTLDYIKPQMFSFANYSDKVTAAINYAQCYNLKVDIIEAFTLSKSIIISRSCYLNFNNKTITYSGTTALDAMIILCPINNQTVSGSININNLTLNGNSLVDASILVLGLSKSKIDNLFSLNCSKAIYLHAITAIIYNQINGLKSYNVDYAIYSIPYFEDKNPANSFINGNLYQFGNTGSCNINAGFFNYGNGNTIAGGDSEPLGKKYCFVFNSERATLRDIMWLESDRNIRAINNSIITISGDIFSINGLNCDDSSIIESGEFNYTGYSYNQLQKLPQDRVFDLDSYIRFSTFNNVVYGYDLKNNNFINSNMTLSADTVSLIDDVFVRYGGCWLPIDSLEGKSVMFTINHRGTFSDYNMQDIIGVIQGNSLALPSNGNTNTFLFRLGFKDLRQYDYLLPILSEYRTNANIGTEQKGVIKVILYFEKDASGNLVMYYNNTNVIVCPRAVYSTVSGNLFFFIQTNKYNYTLKDIAIFSKQLSTTEFYNVSKVLDNAVNHCPRYLSGTTANRPTLYTNQYGFQYYDTTLGKLILWSGTAWTNLDGSALT